MVARGKPAPDLFLHVAREMGVAPENCTVIEDSPAGIAAAKDAGMRVFAFAGGSHAGRAGLLAAFETHAARPGLRRHARPARPAGRRPRPTATVARKLLCAVDVGTGSARAGIFDATGKLLGRADHPIAMNRPRPGHAEHDSEDIWRAVCVAVRGALANAGADPADIAGISFDATCSLVVRDRAGAQLGVSTGGGERWDTIVWLDHRALDEADDCTATGHKRARLSRRRHVAGDADAEADVDQAQPARHLGTGRPVLRPHRFPDLPGVGLQCPLAMHPCLQMDLPRA